MYYRRHQSFFKNEQSVFSYHLHLNYQVIYFCYLPLMFVSNMQEVHEEFLPFKGKHLFWFLNHVSQQLQLKICDIGKEPYFLILSVNRIMPNKSHLPFICRKYILIPRVETIQKEKKMRKCLTWHKSLDKYLIKRRIHLQKHL